MNGALPDFIRSMEVALYIHEVCSAMAIRIGVEGGRMMPKSGNRGKLARIAKRAIAYCNRRHSDASKRLEYS